MKEIILIKNRYNKILSSVISHIEQSKLRAFTEVNKALLQAYWNIGKELSENAAYGKSVVERLSKDLRLKYPEVRGYSVTNLWNMKRFYETYQKLQPLAEEFRNRKLQTLSGESQRLQAPPIESAHRKLQTLPAELIFQISWIIVFFLC